MTLRILKSQDPHVSDILKTVYTIPDTHPSTALPRPHPLYLRIRSPNFGSAVINAPSLSAKRKAEALGEESNGLENAEGYINPLQLFNEQFPEDDHAIHQQSELLILKNNKCFTIRTPSRMLDSPHKPKIQKVDLQSIKEYVIMATSGTRSENVDSVLNEYDRYLEQQAKNKSLHLLPGIMEFITQLLSFEFKDFPETIWTTQLKDGTEESSMFAKIIKYTLTDFHCHCLAPSTVSTHERTAFVDLIVPSFRALAKVTGLVEFYWCEKELISSKFVHLKDSDYNVKNITTKNIDGLGTARLGRTKMEEVLIESSSGISQENVPHTLDDTIKLLECSTKSLLSEASVRKEASFESFKKMKVYCLHHVEVRSAVVPTRWNERILWVKYFEMLATLMIGLREMDALRKRMDLEAAGLLEYEGLSIRAALP
ncbi:hypothetical protein EC973_009625 [Apophysomyces ossiformis]|uniref:Uncharacterized protein n=1 Tax=Apophysomyces ossiformis TaxID=679940 RepID=A0A8H7BLC5_9FUNG|nr:hypothetical protein EC973_009625 [Apophysomyces ossiformis]